jgi:short-subunit dehydrogenase
MRFHQDIVRRLSPLSNCHLLAVPSNYATQIILLGSQIQYIVLPVMITQESGSINVFSMVRGAYANFIAYGTSKCCLEGFTQTLAAEVRSSNI